MPSAKKSGCIRQTSKKYIERPSPPFPAQECAGTEKVGNDGEMYQSVPNVNGVHRWVKKKSASAKTEKKASTTKKKTKKGSEKASGTSSNKKKKASTKKQVYKYQLKYKVWIYDPEDQKTDDFAKMKHTNVSEYINKKGIADIKRYVKQGMDENDKDFIYGIKIKTFEPKGKDIAMVVECKSNHLRTKKYDVDVFKGWADTQGEGTATVQSEEYGVEVDLQSMKQI